MSRNGKLFNEVKELKIAPRKIEFILLLLLILIVIILSILYYKYEAAQIVEAKFREIEAMGDLKVKEILSWRKERITDAKSMVESPFVRKAVNTWLKDTSNYVLKKDLLERIVLEKEEKEYENIFLLDTNGNILLSSNQIDPFVYAEDMKTLKLARNYREPVFSNLFQAENNQKYIDIVSPVIINDKYEIAFILHRNNLSNYLYPLISSWPVPNKSSETVLSQRDGDSAIVLNELKFLKNSALSFKISLSDTNKPTVKAILGYEGSFFGKDYRDVNVLANLQSIPDSPWFIVCKIDREEGMAELRYRVFVIVFFVVIIITWFIGIFYYYHKRFQTGFYKKLYQKEQEINLAITESEEKFRALFENIMEGVALHELVYNNNGEPVNYRIIDVNPAFQSHTGINREKAIGKLATDLYMTESPPYFDEYCSVVKTSKPYHFETFFPNLQKHFFISVVSPKSGQFATVFEDITERKRNEEALLKKNEEMSSFIYTVSHDLKSPLITIKSFASCLKEDINNKEQKSIARDLGYIINSADKMGVLLDELLELSRVGKNEKPKEEISLSEVAHSAIDLVAGRILEKNIDVKVTNEPVLLFGEPQRLLQLYQNLIDNAAKFMDKKTDSLIEVGVMHNEGDIVLFVRDNGKGIDPRYAHRLFGLFEKLDPHSEGTGIGLALVKKIVETHNGSVWFESDGPGKGTTFYFKLEKTKMNNEELIMTNAAI